MSKKSLASQGLSSVSYQLDEEAGAPLYQQVQETIRNHIAEGRLRSGERLPSMQQLSRDMGIAYATVTRGVRELVKEGVLEARVGSGTRVADRKPVETGQIGIFAGLAFSHLVHRTRYYRTLLFLIQETLVAHGKTIVYTQWDHNASIDELLANVRPLDGAIFFHVNPQQLSQVKAAKEQKMPILCVGDTFADSQVPAVHTTSEADTKRVVELLRKRGHRCIAALQPQEEPLNFTVAQRREGFLSGAYDLAPEKRPVIAGSAEELAARLLAMPQAPTALVILNGAMDNRPLFRLLSGTALDPQNSLQIAVWDENLFHYVERMGLPFIGLEQPLQQIAEIAVSELLKMQQDFSYNSLPVYVSSQIVESKVEGQRHLL